MCGICGIVRFAGDPVDRARIDRALAALRHRGPDHAGTWCDSPGNSQVGLGATRLVVLDPSPLAHQPAHRENGRKHLVFNGEIYNYRALREELMAAGESFVTNGDTEVVLAAIAKWGVEALTRFNGMWALAYYDSTSRSGFIARDRFGIKPLFHRLDGHGLAFASELDALRELGAFDTDIDAQAVRQHLQYGYIAHPATIYRKVRRLQPGHLIRFDHRSAHEPTRYYHLPTAQASDPVAYGEACGVVRRALEQSVVARRVSDVPIGAFLSGGIDSSIIVSHLAGACGRQIKTFSVGYAGHRRYDETSYAREVAAHVGTDHHELILTERDVMEAIPRVLDHLAEPVGDSSIVPTSLLCEFARQEVTVALSGDGGDELFGGYWRYSGHATLAAYRRLPRWLRHGAIEPLLRALGASRSSTLGNRVRQFRKLVRADNTDPLACHLAWSRILAPEARDVFVEDDGASAFDDRTLDHARALTAQCDGADPLQRILAFDLQHSLPADMLQKVDLASMMHSLEVRVPFMDDRVVELATSLPSSYKIHRGLRKRILADAYRGRLPDAVVDRPKQGFEVPIGELLRGPLREMFHDTVTGEATEAFGCLSYAGVRRAYAEHVARRADHADLLFALLSLCWWHRRQARSAHR